MKNFLIISLLLFSVALPVSATREEKYEIPDVKNDYCGNVIQFQDCKCAFHNKYCESATKKDSWESRIYVMNKFNSWVSELIFEFAKKCSLNGGEWNKPSLTCSYPDSMAKAVKKSDNRGVEERYNLPKLDFKPVPKRSTVRAKVLNTDGEVFVWSAAFRKWTGPVSSGFLVYNGDVLITTARGEASLVVYGSDGQDLVNVYKDTFLEMPDPTNFKEHDGSLWGILKGKAVEVYNAVTGKEVEVPMWRRQMRTATVTLTTRGTHYIVAYDKSTNTSSIFLNDGEAEITPVTGGSTVFLSAGESYVYTGDGSVATSTMSKKEWDDIRSKYGFDKDILYVSKEDLVAPNIKPLDNADTNINKDDVVPNRNFFEEQVGSGKNYFLWLIVLIIFISAGVYYWKKGRR